MFTCICYGITTIKQIKMAAVGEFRGHVCNKCSFSFGQEKSVKSNNRYLKLGKQHVSTACDQVFFMQMFLTIITG